MQFNSLSHLTFEASSRELVEACRVFYVALGFRVVRIFPDGCVLVAYFSTGSSLPISILIKLTAAPIASASEPTPTLTPTREDEAVCNVPLSASCTPICTFTVPSLSPLEAFCRKISATFLLAVNESFASEPFSSFAAAGISSSSSSFSTFSDPNELPALQQARAKCLLVRDPCGRTIAFTTSPSPASTNTDTCVVPSVTGLRSFRPTTFMISRLSIDLNPSLTPRRSIGIMTSGGDSQGMNAAIRAVVRKAIVENINPFGVRNGYQGLVDNLIEPLTWMQVNHLLGMGGTFLGTARCKDFRTEEGRLRGALNLVRSGIDALVVIGGDGSLTGADVFRHTWPNLLDKLLDSGDISKEQREKHSHLNIVGLVGSIDNDMSLTDMTIGCASALHRICEAVDAICATALSHSRVFVVEVMGRHCGWLAAMAAIATGADYLFVPERPPICDDWESDMCDRLTALRHFGQQKIIVIVSEGAIDRNLKPIKPEYVRDILAQRAGFDARVTTLGHIQRGGSTCFYDRFLATIQGVRAVKEILAATPDTKSPMIGVSQNKITVVPLVDAVSRTKEVSAAIEKKDFSRAMDLRDPEFGPAYNAFVATSAMRSDVGVDVALKPLNIAIIHTGAPASGVNAATRAATLLAINRGHNVYGIYNGFNGLARGDLRELTRDMVLEWTAVGGSNLGTTRAQPEDLGLCALQLQKFNINALLVIGGFEAYVSLTILEAARSQYPALCIPIVQIPATISNNVPGTDYSLGSDTALNFIVYACDTIRQSASATRKRVFIIEVQGGNVGYLTTLGGIAGGASIVYIPEIGINIDMIQRDVTQLRNRYQREADINHLSRGRVILRTESVSKTYTTTMIADILSEEANGLFDARTCVLGHMQQGASPTPLDRIRAARLAALCIEWFEKNATFDTNHSLPSAVYAATPDSVCVIGIRGASVVFSPVSSLGNDTDLKNRRSNSSWWLPLVDLVPMLSVCPETYVPYSGCLSSSLNRQKPLFTATP